MNKHSRTVLRSTMKRRYSLVQSVVAVCLALSLFGCSDEDKQAPAATDSSTYTCEQTFGEVCGTSCSAELPCPDGMFCSSAGTCDADCGTASDCPADHACTSAGSCAPRGPRGQISVEGLPGAGDNDQEGTTCVEALVDFDPVVPQVWLLLDRSGSMDEVLSGTERRWDAIGSVLVGDPTDTTDLGVVGEFEALVEFGATFFSRESSDLCSALLLEETAISLNNYAAVSALYQTLQPGTGTPTAEAYSDLSARVAAAPVASGPKIIIAATDGAPSQCGGGDAQSAVETAVDSAFAQGITTFVINVGDNDSDASHLQRVANLGQGLLTDAPMPAEYFSAANQDSLKEAFRTIVGSAASCVFELNGSVTQANAPQGTVQLLGQSLVYKDPDGWDLRSESEIEILGGACQTIQAGVAETDITIRFPCGVFVPK